MKKLVLGLIGISFVASSVFAVDYSRMTIAELQALKGTVAVRDQAAFKAAMQTKMQALTVAERQAVNQKSSLAGTKAGTGTKGSNASGVRKGQNR